jgi:hypothetical protein
MLMMAEFWWVIWLFEAAQKGGLLSAARRGDEHRRVGRGRES